MTNARFEDLEKRVKKIKLKKYMKFSFVFIILISLSSYLVIQNIPKNDVVKKPLHIKKVVKKQEKKVKQFTPIKKVVKVEKKIQLVKKESKYDTIKLKLNITLPSVEKTKAIEKKEKIIVKKELSKKLNMHVKEVKSEDALLQRFGTAKDFESANGLANLYFEKKSFERSIYWSKKASKLKAKEPSSWLIYAKSKYALGNKKDAIRSLELYLDYFSSEKVRNLLKLYRSNK